MDYSITTPYVKREDLEIHGMVEIENSDEREELFAYVHMIAKYFKRELDYDTVPFSHNGIMGMRYNALLFAEKDYEKSAEGDENCYMVYGAVLFTKANIFAEHGERYVLKWVWLHPFFRNKGKLYELWSEFQNKFGDFYVSTPLSSDMEAFLERVRTEEYEHIAFDV